MGMTFKSFILPRNTPAVKERPDISAKCLAIELFGSLIIWSEYCLDQLIYSFLKK